MKHTVFVRLLISSMFWLLLSIAISNVGGSVVLSVACIVAGSIHGLLGLVGGLISGYEDQP